MAPFNIQQDEEIREIISDIIIYTQKLQQRANDLQKRLMDIPADERVSEMKRLGIPNSH